MGRPPFLLRLALLAWVYSMASICVTRADTSPARSSSHPVGSCVTDRTRSDAMDFSRLLENACKTFPAELPAGTDLLRVDATQTRHSITSTKPW
jgi:hypothetical protein